MIYHFRKQVTTAGVAVPLAAVSIKASFVTVWPAKSDGTSNTGQVRLGGGAVNLATGAVTFPPTSIAPGLGSPLDAGYATVTFPANAVNPWDLNAIYLDADNANDGVQGIYGVV